MTHQEYWQQVDVFLNRALQAPVAERVRILAEIADPRLKEEVASLLDAEDQGAGQDVSAVVGTAAQGLREEMELLRAGSRAGRFEILGALGRGGMGVVYRARDSSLARDVALKFLSTELTGNQEHRRRFEREARAASALNHPNIITVYEIGDAEPGSFIATEYVDGISLRDRLNQGPMLPAEAYNIAAQVVSALNTAHQAGIVHRDVKPENIMLRQDGLVKMLDFGLARVISGPEDTSTSVLTSPGWLVGTPAYMAPEQIRGRPAEPASDYWGLGVILYEMLGRRHPFLEDTPSGTMAAILERRPAPLADSAWALVSSLLKKDPAQRHSNAQAILDRLRHLQRVRRPLRRYAAMAAAAAAVPLLAWNLLRSPPPAPSTSFTYSLLVQRMQNGQPYGASFRSGGSDIFHSGWKFRIEAASMKPGHLYLLSDARVVFPLSPRSRAQQWQTGWLVFDTKPGTEMLWVVWSAERLERFEHALGSTDSVPDVQRMLADARASGAVFEPGQNVWTIAGVGNVVAQPVSLEHR